MFPHIPGPFQYARKEWGALESLGKKHKLGRTEAASDKPIKIDLEKAISVIMSAREVDSDRLRQEIRANVLKSLPSNSIDWNTVDWVQACPFQTVRH